MDPDAYREMSNLMKKAHLPPFIPVPQEQVLDDSSDERKQADPDWTVYSMNVSRGNLGREEDINDPRTHVGWREDATATRKAKDMPWMSETQQQPFMWTSDYVNKDNDA